MTNYTICTQLCDTSFTLVCPYLCKKVMITLKGNIYMFDDKIIGQYWLSNKKLVWLSNKKLVILHNVDVIIILHLNLES